jgi:head-tail adaptor
LIMALRKGYFRDMRQRVSFEELPWVDDGFGGNEKDPNNDADWVHLLTTWGGLFPYWQGEEQQVHGKLESRNEFRLRIRYRKGFQPKAQYRVKYKDPATNITRTFNILYFRNKDEVNKVLEFRMEEVI